MQKFITIVTRSDLLISQGLSLHPTRFSVSLGLQQDTIIGSERYLQSIISRVKHFNNLKTQLSTIKMLYLRLSSRS